MRHLLAILLILAATLSVLLGTSREGVAQTAEPLQRTGSSEAGPPPGGCTPIGVTASGEIVFPLTCRDFIERHKAADRASSEADTKPAPTEISKAPLAPEASKAPTIAEARRAPATAEASKPPTDTEPTKRPTAADSSPADDKEAKPAATQALVDPAARPAANQAAGAPDATGNSEAEPPTTAALPKRGKGRNRVAGTTGTPGCARFRSYDAATASYRDFNGQRRPCP
jgi:hypothetical protein